MTDRGAILLAAVFGGVAVGLGAYHAHGLRDWLARQPRVAEQSGQIEQRMDNAGVAVRYQMVHAVLLAAMGAVARGRDSRFLRFAVAALSTGIVLFSGGLYLIVFTGHAWHWAIVPAGGLSLFVGWVLLGLHAGFGCKSGQPGS